MLGYEGTRNFVAALGGMLVYFPSHRDHSFYENLLPAIDREGVEKVHREFRGSSLYVPKQFPPGSACRSERDAAIMKEFTGRNHRELARKYGISEVMIYRIVRKHRAML
jgi:Mor family transcriptional regulator